jgi:hypothetical protein
MANVTNVKSKRIIYGTDTDAVSVSGTATTLVLLDSGPWINAQTLTMTSSANNSGITFAIVGKDADGAAQTVAAHTGPNATTNSVTGTWTEITSITASGSITTDISAGIKDGATSGIVFGGRTRIRGMNGVGGSGAATLFFKNGSTSGSSKFVLDVDQAEAVAPYIPDNGVLFDDGAYFIMSGTAVVGVSVQYDG